MTYEQDEGCKQHQLGKISLDDFRTLAISLNKIFRQGSGDVELTFKHIKLTFYGKKNSWNLLFNSAKYANGWQNMADEQILPLCTSSNTF